MLKQKDIENISIFSNNFRGDVIAAGLVDNGIDQDTILLLRNDGSTLETDKEIISIDLKQDYEDNENKMLVIKTNRPGIYDNLPEILFHSGVGIKNYNKDNVIEAIRKQHKEEVAIRKFFSLYETEVDRARIGISKTEFEYDRPGKHRSSVDIFGRFWPIIKSMDSQTAILFTKTIPYIAEIRNRYNKIAQAISMIMGYDISIKTGTRKIPFKTKSPRLGVMKLGVNSTLKGYALEKYAVVGIKVSKRAIKDLLPHEHKRKIVEILLDIFMPANISYEIALYPKEETYTSRLGNKELHCVLGINARLNKIK